MGDQTGQPIPAAPILVGRKREMATLADARAAAWAGDGSLVLIAYADYRGCPARQR